MAPYEYSEPNDKQKIEVKGINNEGGMFFDQRKKIFEKNSFGVV